MSGSKHIATPRKDAWLEKVLNVDLAQLRAKALPPPPSSPLDLSKPAPVPSAGTPPMPRLGKAGGAGVALAQCVLLWDRTCKDLSDQIAAMQQEILERASGASDFAAIKAGLHVLEAVLEQLNSRLSEKLNQIFGTPDKTERDRLRDEARQIVVEHEAYIAATPLMGALDGNPFVPSFDGVTRAKAALTSISEYL